ncbi:ABC transporter substrate-binding protein [soil metagenome]
MRIKALGVAVVLLLLLSACLGEGGGAGGGDGDGGVVNVMGTWEGEEAELFRQAIAPFEENTGIEVKYEGNRDVSTLVVTRIEGGAPPDVAFLSPGLIAALAERGELRDLSNVLDVASLTDSVVPGILEVSTINDRVIAVPFRVTVKSLVWYPQPEWDEAGYEVPQTWEELQSLTDQIREGGIAPWCIGVESGDATGWVVTDWIEEFMLRTAGPDAYDRWVAGELPFDSPEVRQAAELFAEVAFTEGNILGSRQGMLSLPFGDAPAGMFEDPPQCFLHRQATFIQTFFPDGTSPGEDYGLFYFPPMPGIGEYDGSPVLGAGDYAGLLTENPAAERFMEYLASPEAGEGWAEAEGSFLSPHTGFDESLYPDDITRQQAQILAQADEFRFDASDLMPPEVGVGRFWSEMVAWVTGEKELQEAMQAIDESYPERQTGSTGDGGTEGG